MTRCIDPGVVVTGAGLVACALLVLAAVIHLHWAAGGTLGKDDAAVRSLGGAPIAFPGPLATALVGVALLAAAVTVAGTAGLVPFGLPPRALRGASAVLALVFAGRAVGEFGSLGFFKRVRGTRFARRDTWVYSPICAALAVLVGVVVLEPC